LRLVLQSRLRKGVLIGLVLFGLMQLFPYRVTHPAERTSPPWDSAQTRRLVVDACYDCHSNETRTRWYDRIAPVSWWITRHVEDGRRAMNFSTWARTGAPLGDAAREVRDGSMPPGYYTWLGLHPSARLSPAQRRALVRGLQATSEHVALGG
jgi:hypothetical protein